jgi:glycosyltransferase involved in cell wall biosynthesis
VHVGIVPSLCEEVYGYVGIEFLANGIPVIGNRRGGIPDYVISGKTGWVNESCTAEELADIMAAVIEDPRSVLPLNKWIEANCCSVIADFSGHLDVVLEAYLQASEKHPRCM